MLNNVIECNVCPNHCIIPEGKTGKCNARENRNGKNYPKNKNIVTSIALDPIEKKPLYHFYPGSQILSLGSFGCNFHCPFCQNYTISMNDGSLGSFYQIPSDELIDAAESLKSEGNIGIAFTYNEPLISYEFVLETEKLAKEKDLKTVIVTNGGINPEIFREIAKYTDAFNIDLKGLDIYDLVGGNLETVKENIRIADEEGSHVEVTTLVIPGLNDSEEEIEEIAKYLASINPNIVLHLTRFFPNFKMYDRPPTPIETLQRLQKVALKYLPNVYLGNV